MFTGYHGEVLIGEGGLGRVYRAVRTSTGGPVAIKELHEVPAASPVWHRAKRELEAMLRLKGHPYVVSVEEIIDGPAGPCLVMEYLPSGTLMDRLGATGPLTPAELVLVGLHVTQALLAAHEVGIVHRDIKPHNLLVGAFGQVKVADFGIAALTREAGRHTRTHAFTLNYASPEELEGDGPIGPPADVYSLAATLSHLATGRKPALRGRAITVDLDELALREPSLAPIVTQLRRCLETQPADRPTMPELHQVFTTEMARLGPYGITHLSETSQPSSPAIDAHTPPAATTIARRPADSPDVPVAPGGAATNAIRFATPTSTATHVEEIAEGRRHRWWVLAALVAIAAIAVTAVITMKRHDDGQVRVEIALSGHTDQVLSSTYSPNGQHVLTASADGTAVIWDTAGNRLVTLTAGAPVRSAAYSPDGTLIVTAAENGLMVWDPDTGNELLLAFDDSYSRWASFSPDSRRLVVATDSAAKVWQLADLSAPPLVLEGHEDPVTSASFSPDGQHILTASTDGTARIWDAATGSEIRSIHTPSTGWAIAAYSPDGKLVVTASYDVVEDLDENAQGTAQGINGTVSVWYADSGSLIATLPTSFGIINSVSFDPTGTRLLVTSYEGTITYAADQVELASAGSASIWDITSTAHLQTIPADANTFFRSVNYSPDGTHVVTGGSDGRAIIWRVDN